MKLNLMSEDYICICVHGSSRELRSAKGENGGEARVRAEGKLETIVPRGLSWCDVSKSIDTASIVLSVDRPCANSLLPCIDTLL